jgi:hypothetical protein
MTKKIIRLTLLAGVLSLAAYFGYRIFRIKQIRSDASRLPHFAFRTLDGCCFTEDMISTGYSRLVINHFSPDCEFCQDMTGRIRDGQQKLGNALIIMVTEADSSEALAFMGKYGIRGRKNILVLRDPDFSFYRKFGTGVVPCFFVYDGNRRLAKRILGETKIEDLIQ